jgi:hypothetical protein
VSDYIDPPPEIVAEVRAAALALPDAHEEKAWAGTRWRIRTRTFAHVLGVDSASGPVTIMTFRAAGGELDVLHNAGHPFFRTHWGSDVVGMVLDATTDWAEVAELVTESYCVLAPKKLVAQVDRPEPVPDEGFAPGGSG